MIKNSDHGPSGLGYLEIDHRAVHVADLPPGTQRYFEADTYTCSHCEVVVVLNPSRVRERYKCKSCAHHVCDACAAQMAMDGKCYPFKQMINDLREQAERQAESHSLRLP